MGVRLADDYYRWIHLPLTILVLAGLFRFRPAHYLWVRTAMAYATAAALVIHIAYPVAPPRMLPRLGFVDTGLRFGQSAYGPQGHDHLANEFAAMPSLHVGWAVLLAVAVIVTLRTPWRWLAVVHPVVTTLVVVVTANHFWLDGLAGTALALAGLAAAPRPGRTRPLISADWRMSGPNAASRLAMTSQTPPRQEAAMTTSPTVRTQPSPVSRRAPGDHGGPGRGRLGSRVAQRRPAVGRP